MASRFFVPVLRRGGLAQSSRISRPTCLVCCAGLSLSTTCADDDEKYVLTKEEIESWSGVEKTHFLNPKAQRRNKSLGDLTGLKGLGFHIIEIEPGFDSTEFHVHYHEEECIYVLAGTADAIVGDETFKVKEGDFIGYRAAGKPHMLVNTGDSTLKCIVVGQRLDHDVGDYPSLKKRIYRHKGLKWNLVDHEHINDNFTAGKK